MEQEHNNNYPCYEYKRYKGQPIEVLTRSGMKYCGILVDVDDNEGIDIIDCKGRTVHIEIRHIEAIVEPRMKLQRLCGNDACCCKHHNDDCNDRDEDDCDCACFCKD